MKYLIACLIVLAMGTTACQKKKIYDCHCKDYRFQGIEDQSRTFETTDYTSASNDCALFELKLKAMSSNFSCHLTERR
jgi:hypothetical protein